MLTLPHLIIACAITAIATIGIAWFAARTWANNLKATEQARHAEAERRIREQYTRELQELQHSLSGELEALRERSRRPLKTLVDAFLN